MRTQFTIGARVEVERVVAGSAAYFPGTVVTLPSGNMKDVLIEFENVIVGNSLHVREYVDPTRIRPAPPRELNRWFKAGDEVDAFRDGEGCWVRCQVRDILENWRYVVGFCGGGGDGDDHREMEVDQYNLRLHREWDDGSWVPPLHMENEVKVEPNPKRLKLIIRFSRGNAPEGYQMGTRVEVRSDEEGYKGSWYSAVIFNCLRGDKYIVEYETMRREDDPSLPLRELTEGRYIRPCPPPLSPVTQFKARDEVDIWYHEGWWIGTVSRVLSNLEYIVRLSHTNAELVCPHSNLRLHQDWINGKWDVPSKVNGDSNIQRKCDKPKRQKLASGEKPRSGKHDRTPVINFARGMKVEVKSDEEGFEGAWFSATILNYSGNSRYTIEYHTLKTEDQTEFLREEAKVSDIRPCPPMIQRVYPYEQFEFVDGWFNEGWWSGQILKVLDEMKYIVYFKISNEELEFDHSDLRPHQEWMHGNWVAASKDCTCTWLNGNMGK